MVHPLMRAGNTTFHHAAQSLTPDRDKPRLNSSERCTMGRPTGRVSEEPDGIELRDELLNQSPASSAAALHKGLQRQGKAGVDANGGQLTRPRSICRRIFLRKIDPDIFIRRELLEGRVHDRAEMEAAELAGKRSQ